MQNVEITLVTSPGCHLCDDAREVVDRVRAAAAGRYAVSVTEQSIADDEALAEYYGEYVPVVLVDGTQHASFRVREDKLAQAIVAAAKKSAHGEHKAAKASRQAERQSGVRGWLRRKIRSQRE